MRRLMLSLGLLLALCACNTVSPSQNPVTSASSEAQSSAPRPDGMAMLHNSPLPGGWAVFPGECGQNLVCVFPKTHTGGNVVTDHDVLYVHPTAPDACDAT